MSESLSNAEKNVWETLNNFQAQLEATFKDNQIVQDYTLLNGFLSFVDSKLTRMVSESLQVQQESYASGPMIEVDDRTVPLILRLYWEKICHPIFKWFQAWRKMISPKEPEEKPKYVEFRKMNAKLTKFFKSTHKFYYNIMEQVVTKYDCSGLMSPKLREELNLKSPESTEQVSLDSNSRFAVLIVMTLHNCLLYLGTTHRYKAVGEKINNRYQLQDFEKSIRYLDMACLFLPSMGEAHLQKGLIYVQTNDFCSAVYQFTRSALARIPSPAAQSNFATMMCDSKSRLRHKFDQTLKQVGRQEMARTRVIDKEIIQSYFLVLFGANFAPQSWKLDGLQGFSNLASLERVLFEKISTRYIKSVQIIFESLIVAIGGFDLLLKSSNKERNSQAVDLKDLTKGQSNYLSFAFSYISHVLHIIREAWEKNSDDFHYLAMVRVVESWLKSNRAVLQYSHRDGNFCKALALLLNDILNSDKFDKSALSNSKPARSYYFEEDVLLKEFYSVKFSLSDFNDEQIFASSDSNSRLMGYVPESERLPAGEEVAMRLRAIVGSGRKFFVKNGCGIVWNPERALYEFKQQPIKRAAKKSDNILAKAQSDRPTIRTKKTVNGETVSLKDLEEQLSRTRQGTKTPDRGYSGSSAPMAPSTFTIKPSSGMTESVSLRIANTISSDGSVQPSSSSTTLSSYSSRSDEKSSMEIAAKPAKDDQEPISAEFLEKQHQRQQNLESFPSAAPPVSMPPYGFPPMVPYNVPFMGAQTGQLHAPNMLYPQQTAPPYGQVNAPGPANTLGMIYPGQPMYQPNNWMAQQQGAYMYGAQPYGAPNMMHTSQSSNH